MGSEFEEGGVWSLVKDDEAMDHRYRAIDMEILRLGVRSMKYEILEKESNTVKAVC